MRRRSFPWSVDEYRDRELVVVDVCGHDDDDDVVVA